MRSSTLVVLLLILGVGSLLGSLSYQAYGLGLNQQMTSQQSQYSSPRQAYPPGMTGGYSNEYGGITGVCGNGYRNGYGGMMGGGYGYGNGGYGYGGMMGQGSVVDGQPVTIQQALQLMRDVPSYTIVIPSNNTIVFQSVQFNVIVLALMPDRAVNLTGRQMPSYATDDVFVVYGLINPTLVVRSGASVQFTVVNLDDDMCHNLVVSSYGPPYGYMSMQGMMSGYWMPYLPPADYTQGLAHEYSYNLTLNQPGEFWYICTYPEHAESGMYGMIMVTN